MRYRVIVDEKAEEDLRTIYSYIADRAEETSAYHYIRRILKLCRSLETFPMRGIARDDLREGLRIVGFRRRVSIAFAIIGDTVRILRVFYGGRDPGVINFAIETDPES